MASRQPRNRASYQVARRPEPFTEDKGHQVVKVSSDLFELGAWGLSRLFGLQPINEIKFRSFSRDVGTAYGVEVAKKKAKAWADEMNRKFGHLKAVSPTLKPGPEAPKFKQLPRRPFSER